MLLVLVCFRSLWQPFCFSSFPWSVVFPLTIGKPLNMRTGRMSKKCGKIAGKSRENQIFISAMSEIPPNKSFQPWNIDIVDASLQYARNIATRKVALTISLAYSTIEEWYYLVRESNKSFKQQVRTLIPLFKKLSYLILIFTTF